MPDPVDLLHVRDHKFVKREKRGCAECGKGKQNMAHVGAPPSVNVLGSHSNHFAYQNAKKAWQERLTELLETSGLPKGLGHIEAIGQVCFPDRARRDQGNYRYVLEKALGDTLVAGGWLPDDDWSRYEFGRLRYAYEKGASWTGLTIYPSFEGVAPD